MKFAIGLHEVQIDSKDDIQGRFPLQPYCIAKRSVFLFFVNTMAELIMCTQCIIRYVWLRYG